MKQTFNDRFFGKWVGAGIVLSILVWLALVSGAVYIIIHFLRKWW